MHSSTATIKKTPTTPQKLCTTKGIKASRQEKNFLSNPVISVQDSQADQRRVDNKQGGLNIVPCQWPPMQIKPPIHKSKIKKDPNQPNLDYPHLYQFHNTYSTVWIVIVIWPVFIITSACSSYHKWQYRNIRMDWTYRNLEVWVERITKKEDGSKKELQVTNQRYVWGYILIVNRGYSCSVEKRSQDQ